MSTKRAGGKVLAQIGVDKISPNPHQPRQDFDPARILDLSKSIETKGQIHPIIVTKHPTEKGKFLIVDGERRWRALMMAEIPTADCVIQEEGEDPFITSLLANMMRVDLNPIEEAEGLQKLHEEHGKKWEEVSAIVGLSLPTIFARLRLLTLDDKVQDMVRRGKLPSSSALKLSQYADKSDQYRIAIAIMRGDPIEKIPDHRKGKKVIETDASTEASALFKFLREYRYFLPLIESFSSRPIDEQLFVWAGAAPQSRERAEETFTEMARFATRCLKTTSGLNTALLARSSRSDRWSSRFSTNDLQGQGGDGNGPSQEPGTQRPKGISIQQLARAQGTLHLAFCNPKPNTVNLGLRYLSRALGIANPETVRQNVLADLRAVRAYWDVTEVPGNNGSAENALIGMIARLKKDLNVKTFGGLIDKATRENKATDPIQLKSLIKEEQPK